MFKPIIVAIVAFFLPFGGSLSMTAGSGQTALKRNTGILEKMLVSGGSVAMDLDLNRLNGGRAGSDVSERSRVGFDVTKDSFFTALVFENELRGPMPGSMELSPQEKGTFPRKLSESIDQLVLEKAPWGEHFEFVVRDSKSGFLFFNIEGHQLDYRANERRLILSKGRILVSNEFAAELGRTIKAGTIVGEIGVDVSMRPIEVTQIVDGEVKADKLPAVEDPVNGNVPGPDVVVGDVFGLSQFGSNGTQVGLALGTTSCNFGTEDLNWFRLPDNDHPVIPQNLYRMSGGASNDERFEQVGQSSVKHAFTALTQNLCGLGCNGVGGSRLGSGCSDPYSAGLNAGPNLGSRAWINPFDGFYPRGDSADNPNDHSGHSHTGKTHRILTEMSDLSTTSNPGAKYFAEGQYITPHEYEWCQNNPGECNMYNNVSYRQYSVSGTTTSFTFSPIGSTQREKAALSAWPGATIIDIEPDPGNDGIGSVAYKVTNPSPGVWHYEYVVYNMNLDRAIQAFSVPLGDGVSISNIGFHAPPQHPGSANDGTLNDAGFSDAAWAQNQTPASMTWSSETFAQNQNANAIRWGTLYNFRFDSNTPPATRNATVGFFKTGAPITVPVMAPGGSVAAAASISGRVTTPAGLGVVRAQLKVEDSGGNIRYTTSNPFGYYSIDGLATGGMYTISVFSKSYAFTPQQVQLDGNLTGIDFVSVP